MKADDIETVMSPIDAYFDCACRFELFLECSICEELALVIDAAIVEAVERYSAERP